MRNEKRKLFLALLNKQNYLFITSKTYFTNKRIKQTMNENYSSYFFSFFSFFFLE